MTNNPEPEKSAQRRGTLRSIFNPSSMAIKFARDVAIMALVLHAPMLMDSAAATPAMYVLGHELGSAQCTLLGALIMSVGRYTGGMLGLPFDMAVNALNKKPLLTEGHARTGLAAIGGFIGALSVCVPALVGSGAINFNGRPENPKSIPVHMVQANNQISRPFKPL